MAMVLKIGIAPCHIWYSSVMTSISWNISFILSTWQKIAPLSVLTFLLQGISSKLIIVLAGLNALIGGLMGINQSHFRTILAYSSITHLGWMCALLYVRNPTFTLTYFLIYVIVVTPLFILFIKSSIHRNSHAPSIINISPHITWIAPALLLSIGGLPPLTGFIPKWIAISILANINPVLLMILISGSIMNLYYYLNIVFSIILSSSKSIKLTESSSYKSLNLSYLTLASTSILFFAPLLFLL
jgi:NADH:ubiquinone oxidoreductase subunit 2 (subunit N)